MSLLAHLKTVGLHHVLRESKHQLMNLHHQLAFRLEKSTKDKFDFPFQRLCEFNCVCVPKTITVSSFTHTIRVAWAATRRTLATLWLKIQYYFVFSHGPFCVTAICCQASPKRERDLSAMGDVLFTPRTMTTEVSSSRLCWHRQLHNRYG